MLQHQPGLTRDLCRIVHLNRNDAAPPPPLAPVFPPPAAFPVNALQVNLAQSIQAAQTYDVAILEIMGVGNAQAMPQPLVLQPSPAAIGDKVFSIGCSHGLPFIYSDGSAGEAVDPAAATVRRLPDPTLPMAHQ
jgi:hypothetical protein